MPTVYSNSRSSSMMFLRKFIDEITAWLDKAKRKRWFCMQICPGEAATLSSISSTYDRGWIRYRPFASALKPVLPTILKTVINLDVQIILSPPTRNARMANSYRSAIENGFTQPWLSDKACSTDIYRNHHRHLIELFSYDDFPNQMGTFGSCTVSWSELALKHIKWGYLIIKYIKWGHPEM